MTMIEMRLVRRIIERGMHSLTEAWSGIGDFGFELGEMESNPQLVQIVPPNEVVVVIGFEVRMGGRTGHDEAVPALQRDRAGDRGSECSQLVRHHPETPKRTPFNR